MSIESAPEDQFQRLLATAIEYAARMPNWIRVAAVQELPAGSGGEYVAGERIVALFNVGGEFYALDGICPHQGGPLGKGELAGCIVTCPWHGWQFDVKTGAVTFNPREKVPTYEVRIEGSDVFVAV